MLQPVLSKKKSVKTRIERNQTKATKFSYVYNVLLLDPSQFRKANGRRGKVIM